MLFKRCFNTVYCFVIQHPLGVQKEPQSAMVKASKLNHERGSLNGYNTGKTRNVKIKHGST